MNLRIERVAVSALTGALGVLVIASMFRLSGLGGGDGVTTIDFGDVVPAHHAAEADIGDGRPTLRIAAGAMVSPKKTRRQYDDLLRLIADRVQRRALLTQRKTYAEINDMIERRQVDVAFVCSAPYVEGKAKFKMELLVVPVTYGTTTYHSYTIVHRDSPANSFDDLRGKVFALTDPDSNSGCLVPKYMLARRGETLESFFGEFYYTYAHDNAIRAVAEGMADGAAVDSVIWEYLQETDPTHTALTRVVEKSPPYGSPPVVVHPDLDADLKGRLREAFLTLHEDQQARSILRTLRIDRFAEVDDAAYDSIRRMRRLVGRIGRQ